MRTKPKKKLRKNSLVGRHRGALTILKTIPHTNKCVVRCDVCRKTKTVFKTNVRYRSRSCGCQKNKNIAKAATTHGGGYSREYRIFQGLHQRCENPRNHKFAVYGKIGVRVGERWSGPHGFVNFIKDLGPRPSSKHSLSRLLDSGPYELGNCVWGSPAHQKRQARLKKQLLKKRASKSLPLAA